MTIKCQKNHVKGSSEIKVYKILCCDHPVVNISGSVFAVLCVECSWIHCSVPQQVCLFPMWCEFCFTRSAMHWAFEFWKKKIEHLSFRFNIHWQSYQIPHFCGWVIIVFLRNLVNVVFDILYTYWCILQFLMARDLIFTHIYCLRVQHSFSVKSLTFHSSVNHPSGNVSAWHKVTNKAHQLD